MLQVGEGLGGQQVLVGHEVNPLVLRQQGDGGHGVVTVLARVALPTAVQLHVAQEMGAFAAGVGTLLTAVLLEARDLQQRIHLVKQVRGNSINRIVINKCCNVPVGFCCLFCFLCAWWNDVTFLG